MKKILLTLVCAMTALFAVAQTETNYKEQYVATVNGEAQEARESDITVVDNGDGTINFVLRDFVLNVGGNEMPVGDISLTGVPATKAEDGLTYFAQEGQFTIPAENIPADYAALAAMGYFNDIPYTLQGKYSDVKLFANINIDMSKVGQTISVVVGDEDFSDPADEGKVYTEQIVVSITTEEGTQTSNPQTADVTVVDNGDGTINFVLKNFILKQGGVTLNVGNIALDNLAVTKGEDGLDHISFDGTLVIQNGDLEGVDFWVGPFLGEIPLKLEGKMNEEKLFATIDISMAVNGQQQDIHVEVGTDDFSAPVVEGKVYTEQIIVSITTEEGTQTSDPQEANVTVVDNGDGTINFVLKNFILKQGDVSLNVGNIALDNLAVTKGEDGLDHISFDGNLLIQNGDLEGVDFWVGPFLGEIPLKLEGKMNDEKLFATIDISMAVNGQQQDIHVEVGTDDFSAPVVEGKVYTEQIVVSVTTGEGTQTSDPQTADVTVVDNGDGTINFVLKNFILKQGDVSLNVGNIALDNLAVTKGEDGLDHISFDGNLLIQNGDLEGVDFWVGPFLGEIPLKLEGKMNDEKLFATIDISMAVNGQQQDIHVEAGTDTFAPATVAGDVNGDGSIDIADAVSVLNIMAEGTNDPVGDVNGDEKVDIADFVSVLNIMAEQ